MRTCSNGLSSDDPYFLVNFIMSNYLGPDVFSDNPRCSASQRLSKNLPPYTPKHIGASSLTLAQLQNLYYYVLRNANSTLLLHPDMVLMYLKGYLPMEPSRELHQFTHYFPTNLHPQKRYSPSLEIVKGIVVIEDPALTFIRKEELQRFRLLSRLDDLRIDKVASLSPLPVNESRGSEQDCLSNGNVTPNGLGNNQVVNSSEELEDNSKRKKEEEAVATDAVCVISNQIPQGLSGDIMSNGLVTNQECNTSAEPLETCKRKKDEEDASCGIISKTPERFRETYKRRRFKNSSTKVNNGETLMDEDRTDHQPTSLPLVIVPPEMKSEPAVVTTGTISRGTSFGSVDIGVNEVAYFFQVALPGVSKDNGEFSCEIASDGKVTLEGSIKTGQKTIERHSRVFKMINRKLCPSGPFKLSFNLPGPVDPRLVSPNFRSDGIFEAVVIRQKPEVPSS
ncbi:unnamed protein product [Eruca vesicaria subsp. sativa]|uniref:Increased DNA methylation 3 n=1 Tax=Eruca vesicaria subsp. sativa TaxID=29727 RepID=A0ABC8JZY2_ERUVS|nr:unnamed protein product [Eruca vesicaria subsp. sativa]